MDKLINVSIVANEKQKRFFKSRNKFILYGGSKGGGKSWAIRTKQILRRLKYPNSKGLLLRRTFPELQENHIFKIQEEWKGLDWNSKDSRFMFPNGSYLKLGSAQFEVDILKYQGSEFDDIGIDECTNFTKYQFDILRSCLRTTNPKIKTQIYLGGNPGGVGHGWVKSEFITHAYPDHEFIPAKVYDNYTLMKADPTYLEELKKLPTDLRKAFLEGDWDVFSGQVFTEWRPDKHVVKHFEYPLELCKKTIGFDWGFNAPGCAIWLAHTPDMRIYAYRELYQSGKNPEEWAKQIMSYIKNEPIESIILPHDCFATVQGHIAIADVFRENGITRIQRGKTLSHNARLNRLAIMHQYLSEAPDGRPYLQVHESCRNLIETLPELVYNSPSSGKPSEDVDSSGSDHCYDAISVALLEKVMLNTGGGIKPVFPQKGNFFEVDTHGDIITPDFWKQFTKDNKHRSWKYIN